MTLKKQLVSRVMRVK